MIEQVIKNPKGFYLYIHSTTNPPGAIPGQYGSKRMSMGGLLLFHERHEAGSAGHGWGSTIGGDAPLYCDQPGHVG